MDYVTATFSTLMLGHVVLGLVLCVAVVLWTRWRHTESAAACHSAWLLVLGVLTAMPLAVLSPDDDQAGASIVIKHQVVEVITDQQVRSPDPIVTSQVPLTNRDSDPGSSRSEFVRLAVTTIWLGTALWQIALLARAWVGGRRLRQHAWQAPASVQRIGDELAERVRLRRSVPLRTSARIGSPQTNGTWRPVILIPEHWSDGCVKEEVVRHALAHELAHLRRGDHWVVWLQFAARILFGFNPAVWYAIHQIEREREAACDDWALKLGTTPKAYASSLVTVAESLLPGRGSELAVSCLRSRNHLRQRISHMLDRKKNHSTRPLGLVLVATTAVAVVGVATAAPVWSELRRVLPIMSISGAGWGFASMSEDRTPAPEDGLLWAAWNGDAPQAERLLGAGADPDQIHRSRDPRTPLVAAIRREHWEIAQLLVDAGADVNFHARGDESPLMATAARGESEMVRYLIERGAKPNVAIRGDGTPLIAASRAGDVEAVRALLEAGADPDRYVRGDEAPLFHAVVRGHQDVVALLLDSGADPSVEYRGDGTPLMLAIRHGHDEIARMLVAAGASVSAEVRGDGTALIDAARRNDVATAKLLVASGADVDQAVRGDGNALINAAMRGHLDMASLLVEAGADVNAHVRGDDTPLINAARSGNPELVRALLDAGADPNQIGDYDRRLGMDRTALNQAENDAVRRLLADAGAAN